MNRLTRYLGAMILLGLILVTTVASNVQILTFTHLQLIFAVHLLTTRRGMNWILLAGFGLIFLDTLRGIYLGSSLLALAVGAISIWAIVAYTTNIYLERRRFG